MATAYQIEASGDWVMFNAYANRNQAGTALYVRLYEWSGADEIGMWKSTDDGATWNPVGTNFVPGGGGQARAGSGLRVGDVIYIPYQEWVNLPFPAVVSSQLKMARFDMSTDQWLSPWSGPFTDAGGFPAGFDLYIHACQCGVRSDGTLVVLFTNWIWDVTNQRSRWQCVTVNGSGSWGTAVDVSSYQVVFGAPGPIQGNLAIDSADTAHFVFPLSGTGYVHVSWTSGGALSGATTIAAVGNLYNSVIANISGVESLLIAANPTPLHGVYSTPVSAISFTFTAGLTAQEVQWLAANGNTVCASSPQSGTGGGGWDDIVQTPLIDLGWGTPETIEAGAELWSNWTSNRTSAEIAYVAESYNDFTPWFLRYPVSVGIGPACRYYAM